MTTDVVHPQNNKYKESKLKNQTATRALGYCKENNKTIEVSMIFLCLF